MIYAPQGSALRKSQADYSADVKMGDEYGKL
jgi:hypothetical protein